MTYLVDTDIHEMYSVWKGKWKTFYRSVLKPQYATFLQTTYVDCKAY